MQAIPRTIENDDDLLKAETAFDGAIADIKDKATFLSKFVYGEDKINLHIIDRLRDAMADMNQCLHIATMAEDLMVKYHTSSPEKSVALQEKLSEAKTHHKKGDDDFKTIISWIPQINTRRGDGRA